MMVASRQKFSTLSEGLYKFAASRNRCANVLIHPAWMFSYVFSNRRSYVLSNSLSGKPFEQERMFTKSGHGFALEPFYD